MTDDEAAALRAAAESALNPRNVLVANLNTEDALVLDCARWARTLPHRAAQRTANVLEALVAQRQQSVASPAVVLSLLAEREALRAEAMRYRYLRDHCSGHYAMTHEQPAEWHVHWEFQQVRPDQRYETFDSLIDADIARLDDEARAALSASAAP